ncbi:S24 family peptidase [Marinilactibacillus sp. Marseille-P9653]|uniref:S24 family peptidase n=1 Tax=Marinilactibacillus sp. Marseille-P9653 TaxID=2866583 RepID=UPI001CE4826B|nr:S24 family peptidase [Marinilactibacillus sp. Marseille-P9653]
MHLMINTPNLNIDDLIFSKVTTTNDNPYFTNGSIIAIDTNVKPDFWSTIQNGDFVTIESNGLTAEKEMTVQVTKKENTLLLKSTSSYFDFETELSITNLDSIKVVGKVVFSFKSFNDDVDLKIHN